MLNHKHQIFIFLHETLQRSFQRPRPSGPKVQNLCRRLGYLEDEAFGPFPGTVAVTGKAEGLVSLNLRSSGFFTALFLWLEVMRVYRFITLHLVP